MRIVSNETRDKLKKMGLSQKTMFVWCTVLDETWIELRKNVPNIHDDGLMIEPIYDLSFLVEALPYKIKHPESENYITRDDEYFLHMDKAQNAKGQDIYNYWYVNDCNPDDFIGYMALSGDDTNPAEEAAQLLIYIVEQGYAETKNGKVVAV